jgi:RND family efflux transporter MFP subunit
MKPRSVQLVMQIHKLLAPASHHFTIAGLLITWGAALAGCAKNDAYRPPDVPKVSVAKPLELKLTDELDYTGNLQAVDSVEIRARVNGYLDKIHFRDGQNVEQDQLLFEIEEAPFRAALDSAEANKLKAEASLKLAEAELRRTSPLVERGAAPTSELDEKSAGVATAKADVAYAAAMVTQAKLNLDYTKVRAPLSGRIGRHMVDPGNLIESQGTVLTTIERYDPIHAYFSVSESDVPSLPQQSAATLETETKQGENYRLDLKTDSRPRVFVGLPGEEGYPHEGRLDYTQLGIDPSTGTQQRRAIFQNADQKLVPGSFVRVRVPYGDEKPRLLVPERAVGVDQRGEYVLVVNAKNMIEDRRVVLGAGRFGLRVVIGGLQPNDLVIINGLQRVRPAMEVKPEIEDRLPGVNMELVRSLRKTKTSAVDEATPVAAKVSE